eukprot:CAMPEP_0170553980 /NCGR_PEP_ID=MMETSP0211-20121228/11835_1 /TAXON_ID=311385 /ORGANISM="Pseudokeronopsis sp., Strain OXSARD2" /LENGTH=104 /DNA_ID=CAMNT_0010862711 /DNA_START=385 /DNA_END=699 /DNA_ORIENTATION=-
MIGKTRTYSDTFDLDLLDGCLYATYTYNEIGGTTDAMDLRTGSQTFTIQSDITSDVLDSICGTFTYDLLQDWTTLDSTFFSFDPSTKIITVDTEAGILPATCGT